MKLDKAIEIVGEIIRYQYSAGSSDNGNAIKLLVQAGIRVRNERINPGAYKDLPLQGED